MKYRSNSCEKVYYENIAPLKRLASREGNIFWKSSRSEKVAPQKKIDNAEYCFSEKLAFFQNVALLKKLMLCRGTCFEKATLL